MGSWLGRVAARYRLSVAQLVEDYHLQIPLETSRAGWLLLPLLQSDVLQRLADLARMKIGLLRDIQTPYSSMYECRSCPYCTKCLFVNPEDVTSPMWKRQWFNPEFEHCTIHAEPLESLPAGRVRRCRNFDAIVKLISRTEQRRRLLQHFYRY